MFNLCSITTPRQLKQIYLHTRASSLICISQNDTCFITLLQLNSHCRFCSKFQFWELKTLASSTYSGGPVHMLGVAGPGSPVSQPEVQPGAGQGVRFPSYTHTCTGRLPQLNWELVQTQTVPAVWPRATSSSSLWSGPQILRSLQKLAWTSWSLLLCT